jgi:hypothetical protein
MAAHVTLLSRCGWPFALAVALTGCGSDSNSDEQGGAAGNGGDADVKPYPRPDYTLLSETGLYADVAADELASGPVQFEPSYQLWSDGATKRRWLELPSGGSIDTTDLNHWQFPIGTRLWKEFSADGVRVETRLIERYGKGRDDYFMGAFVWRADGSDAELRRDGEQDARQTSHDVPSQEHCGSCHEGEPGRILGFSALQLSREDRTRGPTLTELSDSGRLSDAPPDPGSIGPPGEDDTAAALGYLHANCGNCHNLKGTAWPDTQMVLRLGVDEHDAETTELYQSVIDQPLQNFPDEDATDRVVPGAPARSGLVVRMTRRGPREQMPPLASEVADEDGIALVTRWIENLSR